MTARTQHHADTKAAADGRKAGDGILVLGGKKSVQGITPAQRKAARILYQALGPWRRIRETMPMQYVVTFLTVALDEGQGVLDYARKLGVAHSVMSRQLQDIGPRNRFNEPGFGLIDITTDPINLRRKAVTITPKGRALLHDLAVLLVEEADNDE